MSRSEAMKAAWARRKAQSRHEDTATPTQASSRIISYKGVELVLHADIKRVVLENDSIVIP